MVRILDILDIKMTKFLLSVGTSGGRCGAGGFQCLHRARGTCKGISEDTGRAGVTPSVSISPNSSKPTAEPTSTDQKHCTNAQEKQLEPRVWQCDVAERAALTAEPGRARRWMHSNALPSHARAPRASATAEPGLQDVDPPEFCVLFSLMNSLVLSETRD